MATAETITTTHLDCLSLCSSDVRTHFRVLLSASTSSPCSLGHGDASSSLLREADRGPHQVEDATQGEGSSSRLRAGLPHGPTGSKGAAESVTVHGTSCSHESPRQSSRSLAPLRSVQREDGVHPSTWIARTNDEDGQHGMVKRMLSQLRDMLGDSLKPTAAICLAMQQKVDADEKLEHLIREHRMSQSTVAPAPRPSTATATAGYPTTATPTRRSPTPPRDSADRSSNEGWQLTVASPDFPTAETLQEAYSLMDHQ